MLGGGIREGERNSARIGISERKEEPSACTAQKAKAHQCLSLFICTVAMKIPGCHNGVSCTAAVWDIASVQMEGVQQLHNSSLVWVAA